MWMNQKLQRKVMKNLSWPPDVVEGVFALKQKRL